MHIQQLILETAHLDKLTKFYGTVLQLPVEKDKDQIAITTGSSTLVFKETNEREPVYHFAFTIPANKIEEAKEWLKDKVDLVWIDDYNSDIADFVSWHAKSVYCYDPAGNIVELIARFDLENKTEAPFSAKQLLSVSEAGIVTPKDTLQTEAQHLLEQYGLSYFAKQPPLPQFKAIGDDEGLFILVPEERNWFPTSIASAIYPMDIYFTHDQKKYHWTNH
jgi:catechol 2,3-dioxygenase-like lactoylglutathione lyase family enzyme